KTEIENLFLIPSNSHLSGADLELVNRNNREFVLREHLEETQKYFDFIFIGCPPSLGLITVNCLVASDYIMIPLQCEYYALEGLGQLLQTFELVKRNLNPNLEIGGVMLTMADFRTNLTQQVIEEVRNYFKEKVFETVIPRSVKLSEAPSFGKPAIHYDPQNRGSKGYRALGDEIIKRFDKKEINKQDNGESFLSDREKDILILIGKALTSEEIASKLKLSKRTIDTHRIHLMQKLNLENLPKLIRYAVQYSSKFK
ncbi:MAG: AAA family ATPase, partial [Bacteroidetes bacterium]|nr:AAA family ATPase [Bacteroidota bacterium]